MHVRQKKDPHVWPWCLASGRSLLAPHFQLFIDFCVHVRVLRVCFSIAGCNIEQEREREGEGEEQKEREREGGTVELMRVCL